MACQQYELYSAEEVAPRGREFTSVEEMQRFVDDLRETWWWKMRFPMVHRIEVGAAPKNGGGSVGGFFPDKGAGRVEMMKEAGHWCERILLHEISHVFAAAAYDSKAHDPQFARTYIDLVSLVMGEPAYTTLYNSFVDADIQFDYEPKPSPLERAKRMPQFSPASY